jgi:Mce-associated membrane protein
MSKHRLTRSGAPLATADKDEAVAIDTEQPDTEQAGAEVIAEITQPQAEAAQPPTRRIPWTLVLAYRILPGLALLLAIGAGYLKWMDATARDTRQAGIESVQVATASTIAMLSYRPDTVEKDLGAARDRMTGQFKDSYNTLTHDVVIPQAKQKRISAAANVPAAASVSASPNHAVALVFVNQTVVVGTEPPTDTPSSVRVTLDKISGRWLISDFTPVRRCAGERLVMNESRCTGGTAAGPAS